MLPFRHGDLTMSAAIKLLTALVFFFGFAAQIPAEDWMFRRSYYSHVPAGELPPDYPQPVSRSAYRIAHYRYGYGVNAGYRINNYIIQNGNRIDRTYYTEGWVEFNPQP
jgi:hypothetical protein